MTIKVKLGDGRVIEVDDGQPRYQAFNSRRTAIADALGLANLQARDAQEVLAFMVSQLAYTEAQTFEKLYVPMQYKDLIPLDFSAGEFATSIRYELYDYAGRGKRTSGKGKDLNLVEVAYADKSFAVVQGDIAYDYTSEELRQSAALRKPLPSTRLAAAIQAYERHMNDVGLFGEASDGLTGLFNNTFVPHGNAPTGNWATATQAEILADINALITNVWTNTAFNDLPTDIIIAPTALALIASKPRSDNSDKTVLSYVMENNIAKTQAGRDIKFTAGFTLDTRGVGNTRRMMAYVKDPSRLVMHIPLPLRFLAPQLNGLAVEIPGEYKYSGVEYRYPKSAYYMDGI